MTDAITDDTVRHLASLAGLPLTQDRLAPVAELLNQWIPPANALSARMQAEELRELMPAVVFTQGRVGHEETGA